MGPDGAEDRGASPLPGSGLREDAEPQAVVDASAGRGTLVPRRPFGFPKFVRLRLQPDIRRVQRKGARWRLATMTVCRLPNDLGHARFGFAVSRKVGNAVTRNRVKRRLREVFRHLRPELGSEDVLVLARPPAADASLAELDQAVREAVAALQAGRGSRARRSRSR